MTKHNIQVGLIGEDGNAFSILGKVMQELRKGGVPDDEVKQYYEDATSGDYDHLLRVTTQWVQVV